MRQCYFKAELAQNTPCRCQCEALTFTKLLAPSLCVAFVFTDILGAVGWKVISY